ncbi:MAG: hypothetical protein ACLSE6_01320 [Alphaproteobacteria bacterium]
MLEDISALENCTVSSVPDGYDAFLLAQLWEKSARDILYIVSDGVALENTAHILSLFVRGQVLNFRFGWSLMTGVAERKYRGCAYRCAERFGTKSQS